MRSDSVPEAGPGVERPRSFRLMPAVSQLNSVGHRWSIGPGSNQKYRRIYRYSTRKKYDEGVSMDEILSLANQSKAKDKVILLDCCHSGALGTPTITGNNIALLSEACLF